MDKEENQLPIDKPEPIPDLSPHYYKSRNSLLLFSGLLLAWELMNITVNKEFEAPSLGATFNIENVDAIPYVIFVLILYFVFRLILEWRQSDKRRRNLPESKIDLYVSLIIPVLAVSVYSIQRWFDISVFEGMTVISIFQITNIIITILLIISIIIFYRIRGFTFKEIGIYYGLLFRYGYIWSNKKSENYKKMKNFKKSIYERQKAKND